MYMHVKDEHVFLFTFDVSCSLFNYFSVLCFETQTCAFALTSTTEIPPGKAAGVAITPSLFCMLHSTELKSIQILLFVPVGQLKASWH